MGRLSTTEFTYLPTWRHCGVRRLPAAISTNTTENHRSIVTSPTNQP